MTTNAICIVNGIKFQKDLPKSTEISTGLRPIASAAAQTTATAIPAKT